MIPLERALFIKRKDVAALLNVSIHMLEVWSSNGSHAILHKEASKVRGRCYYKLGNVEDFLKEWDKERYYEIYTRDGKGFINWLAKLKE